MNTTLDKQLLFPLLFLSLFLTVSCRPGSEGGKAGADQAESKYLAEAKKWDKKTFRQLDNMEASLTTSWREGNIYYTFDVSPHNGCDRYISDTLANNRFSVHLEDMSSMNLLTIDVPLSKMKTVSNSNGTSKSLQMIGSARCTKQIYKTVTDWSLTWSFPLATLRH